MSATDTDLLIRIIGEQINMIDWTEAPLLKELGLNNESKFRFKTFGSGTIEWIEDTMSPLTDAINGAIGDTVTTSVTVDNGSYFREGHVIQIDSEYMYVRSVSGNVLTVSRGFAGTTAATHSDDAAVTIITIAKVEGANYTLGHTTTVTTPDNYTQEIEESVQETWRSKSTPRYGVGNNGDLEYHLAKLIGGRTEIGGRGRAGQLAIILARMAYFGKKQAPSGTTLPAAAGGFPAFISTNSSGSTSTELTLKLIEDELADIQDAGGSPNLLVTGSWGIRKITNMFKDTIRTERSDKEGGSVISSIKTPVGSLEVMYDKWCPAGEAYILDTDKVGWVTINPFDVFEKPSLGTYDVKMVWGEYSFVVANEKAHAKLTFSTSK